MIVDETAEGFLHRPDITDRLPRYRLLRQLSETEMSEVFLAVDTTLNRRIALKVVGPESLRGHTFRDRFERESEIALTLEHPNIVPVYAAGESADGELCYLAMRYIRGSNLHRVLNDRGGLGLPETIAVARQIAAALDAAHDRGLIHRDVKPANILVEEGTNQVYVCDFGIAKNTALATLSAPDAFVGTLYYSAPEQTSGDNVDHRADIYSLGRVIRHCLTGHPPYADPDKLDLRTARRLGSLPLTGSPVDRVLRKAMAPNPNDRYATCGELVEALAAAKTARSRRRSGAVALVVLGSVALLILLFVVFNDPAPERVALTRVPAALRDDCRTTEASTVDAAAVLSCRDTAGRTAVSALFDDRASVDNAYTGIVGESGVAPNQGDCAAATGAEHRYPAAGPGRGRVLCHTRDGLAVIVWTDDDARTVNRAEAPDAAALHQAWSAWTGAEAFPTADERALLDVAAGSDCARVSGVDLDAFPAAVAGVTCVARGSGAREVSYYRFASLPDLQAGVASRVDRAEAPNDMSCASGTAAGFLGTHRHNWLGVDLGQVLCRPSPNGTLAMEWSMEPLSMIGRVTGDEPAALAGWWSQWHLAPLSRIIDAVNAQTAPPFPTEPERALLAHIPPVSRVNCVRPSPEQVWRDVGATSAVGVACGQTSGAELVVYYQFQDVATMRSIYGGPDSGGPNDDSVDCTSLPSDFTGDRGYSRAGGGTGRLRCGVVEGTGERYLEWTDDRLAIRVLAYRGTEPIAMIDWWTHDAGPI